MYEDNFPKKNNESNDGQSTTQNTYGQNTPGQNTYATNQTPQGTSQTTSQTTNQTTSQTTSQAGGYTPGSYAQSTGTYSQAAGSYGQAGHYMNNRYDYQNGATVDLTKKEATKKLVKEKKPAGFFKRAVAFVVFGIFFGGFAGLSFFSVNSVMDMVQNGDSATVSETEVAAIADINDTVAEIGDNVDTDQGILQTTDTLTAVVTDVTDVVEEVMPSVVSINNYYTASGDYYGQTYSEEAQASGSGIIVGENDTELLVVTNYHVVADADTLEVQFIDGETVEAQIKGSDSDIDLAIIAIPLDSLLDSTKESIAIAQLGDSDSLKVGEPAIAIGNALGYGQSVTTGVISAVNRELTVEDVTNNLIQTDAAINPGNSGGALLNVNGEVIGINSNKIGGDVIEGMGYAIPISEAIPIIEELMTQETRVKIAEENRGYLGISGVDVTADVSEVYGIPEGISVQKVYEGTAAEDAGLMKGDIITEFDGTTVNSMEELVTMLEYYAQGDTVEIVVMQLGQDGYESKTVELTLGGQFS